MGRASTACDEMGGDNLCVSSKSQYFKKSPSEMMQITLILFTFALLFSFPFEVKLFKD